MRVGEREVSALVWKTRGDRAWRHRSRRSGHLQIETFTSANRRHLWTCCVCYRPHGGVHVPARRRHPVLIPSCSSSLSILPHASSRRRHVLLVQRNESEPPSRPPDLDTMPPRASAVRPRAELTRGPYVYTLRLVFPRAKYSTPRIRLPSRIDRIVRSMHKHRPLQPFPACLDEYTHRRGSYCLLLSSFPPTSTTPQPARHVPRSNTSPDAGQVKVDEASQS